MGPVIFRNLDFKKSIRNSFVNILFLPWSPFYWNPVFSKRFSQILEYIKGSAPGSVFTGLYNVQCTYVTFSLVFQFSAFGVAIGMFFLAQNPTL